MAKIVETGDWNKDIEGAFKKGIGEFKSTGTW
jgi:F-type H+-transporting ATPase subunit alpha